MPTPSKKGPEKIGLKIRIVDLDTFTAVSLFPAPAKAAPPRIAVLSMASPLRPGGGVFTGAQSQEESLCVRSTLYPSLKEEFYRLPPLGCIYTPDVLVFRDEQNKDLAKRERFYVDVVSCAALRFPEVEGGRYENPGDREQMWEKMKLVMRAAVKGGANCIVLGAWGCGAYGNPVEEVADGWKRVLGGGGRGGRGNKEEWNGMKDVVFAISTKIPEGKHQLEVFRKAFEGIALEEEVVKEVEAEAAGDDEGLDEVRARDIRDLEEEILLKQSQLDQVKNENLRNRIAEIIVMLKKELEAKSPKAGEHAGSNKGEANVEDDFEDAAGGGSSSKN